jgi:beta-glucosidase/6-phospho-beta-glucosidase/beta-galactosidase
MNKLQELIQDTIKIHYQVDYQAGVSDAEALGVMIAQYFDWDGIRILDAFQAALTDANFHNTSWAIDAIRDKEGLR